MYAIRSYYGREILDHRGAQNNPQHRLDVTIGVQERFLDTLDSIVGWIVAQAGIFHQAQIDADERRDEIALFNIGLPCYKSLIR